MNKSNEIIFKPFRIINISIYSLLLLGIIYFKLNGRYDNNYIYLFGSIMGLLLFFEIRGQIRHSFLLKINNKLLSYKDDKKIIHLKDIDSFIVIPGMFNNPSKLIITTKTGIEELILENYNRIKLGNVSKALNEKLTQLV